MQRVSALWQASPLKLVGALFVLMLAAMMAVASGASFTSTSANAGNIVTAGNLSHSNSKARGAILDVADLMPGESPPARSTSPTPVTSTACSRSRSPASSTPTRRNPLSAKLDLWSRTSRPDAPPPRVKYNGKLGAMGASALGTFAAGEAPPYRFTVTFPDGGTPAGPTTGDNAYKGDASTVEYDWESVSTSHAVRSSRPSRTRARRLATLAGRGLVCASAAARVRGGRGDVRPRAVRLRALRPGGRLDGADDPPRLARLRRGRPRRAAAPGDVITYVPPGARQPVTHRIISAKRQKTGSPCSAPRATPTRRPTCAPSSSTSRRRRATASRSPTSAGSSSRSAPRARASSCWRCPRC